MCGPSPATSPGQSAARTEAAHRGKRIAREDRFRESIRKINTEHRKQMMEDTTMGVMEMVILVGLIVPLVVLTGAFLVLVTWLQVCEETGRPAHGEA